MNKAKSIVWLHLSDLHSCKPMTGWDAHRVLKSLRTDLKHMQNSFDLCPQFIFFTGDAAFGQVGRGNGETLSEQFDDAQILLKEVCTAFRPPVSHENVFLVPGNHDVDRSEVGFDQTDWLERQKDVEVITRLIQRAERQWARYMERLVAYRDFLGKYDYKHLLADPVRLVYAELREVHGIKVGIAGLNSAWTCGRDAEKGKLWMGGDWQIGDLTGRLADADFRIALMHHPFGWFVQHEDPILRPLMEREFAFFLHGHEHQGWVDAKADGHVRVAAAACYERSTLENGYNFVRLDFSSGQGEVWLRRYDSHGGDWVPRIVAHRTDNNGRWSLTNWLQRRVVNLECPYVPDKPPSVMHNLPFAPNPSFTGRDTEMQRLGEWLQKHGKVALHGLGGVGKTQLAVEYAWKRLKGYEAVLWVKADGPEALDSSLAALSRVLGVPEASVKEQDVQTKAVLGWLHGHERWLLIADNVDTDEAAGALGDRLPPSLPGQVLITSRISDWPVNIEDLTLDLLSPDDATRYLLGRVARKRHNAGDEAAARSLADELGDLPLALEQAASFIVEMRWSFAKYQEQFRDARPELLREHREGGTRYPASVAKTWSITLERLSLLSRVLSRLAAWFAPDLIPRGIFSAKKGVVSEALGEEVSDLAIDRALGELDRFSLVRLTSETVSVHRLLQAVEQDSLGEEKRKRQLVWAIRLFNAFAPGESWDVSTWGIWVSLGPHAESLLEHTNRYGDDIDMLPIALMADQFGSFLQGRGAYATAEPLYTRALKIREKELGSDHLDVANSLNNLAALYHAQGHYAEAEPLYQRAQAIRRKVLGPEHPDVAQSLQGLAVVYHVEGRYAEAELLHKQALAIREKTQGPNHPDVASGLNDLAALYHAQRYYAEAEPLYKRALAIRQEKLSSSHPDVAQSLNDLAELYRVQGRDAEAEPLYEQARAIFEKALGLEHPKVAWSLQTLAALYQAQGHYVKAESLYQRALALRENALGPKHPNVAHSLNYLAELYRVQGRYADAEPLYERALTIFKNALGPNHLDVAACLKNYAFLLRNMSRPEEAEPLEARARAIRDN